METNRPRTDRADLVYAITYSGAIGSAVVASIFLLFDTLAGRPLDTPILMGSALFLGEVPTESGPLRLDLAAAYSILHFVMFTWVGGLFAVLTDRLQHSPAVRSVLMSGIFLTLSGGLLALDALVAPSLASAIGIAPILIGNMLAAGGMTWFYTQAFGLEGAWVAVPTTLIGDADGLR